MYGMMIGFLEVEDAPQVYYIDDRIAVRWTGVLLVRVVIKVSESRRDT